MSPRHSFLLPCFLSFATAAVFQRRGGANEPAPYANVTALTSRSSTTALVNPTLLSSILPVAQSDAVAASSQYATEQPTSAGSSGSSGPISNTSSLTIINPTPAPSVVNVTYLVSSVAGNATASASNSRGNATETLKHSNASCTVHIPSASIDYWHPPSYRFSVATMTTRWGNFSNANSITLVPETTTFDVASAITSYPVCTDSAVWNSDISSSETWCFDFTDIPTVASTAVVSRSAYVPFPSGGVIPKSDARLYDIAREPLTIATTTVSLAPNRTFIESSSTPFVRFTAYEIESGNKTETVTLSAAQIYPYYLKGVDQNPTATGPLPDEFISQIADTNCEAGQLQATVTVVVVVDLFYENNPINAPMIVHFESSAEEGFDEPTAVNINDATSRGVPMTMDWDFPGVSAKPSTTEDVRPNVRTDSIPTTQPGSNNNGAGSNEAQVPNPPAPTQVTVGTVGTVPVVIGPSSQIVVGTQTLRPNDAPVFVDGTTPVQIIASGTSTAIVVAGTTSQLPQIFNPPSPDLPAAPPLLTLGSTTLTPNAATQFFIAPSQTLTPGGTVNIDGTVISLAPSASFVVIGSTTQFLAPAAAPVATSPPQIVFGSSTITALSSPGPAQNNQNGAGSGPSFVVDGQTLVPGAAITVSGSTISLVPGGSSVVINGVTSAVVNPVGVPQPTIRVGDSTFTEQSGNSFVIGGQTLAPNGQAITVSGTTLSLGPSASFVVVNGATSALPNPANPAAAQITVAPVLTIGDGIFRPLPGTGTSYLIGSSVLTPGGSVVIADTTISLAPGATALIINGKTSIISPSVQGIITNAPLLTIGTQTYTAVSGTTFIISGQTLTPGGTITVDGTTIRLAPGATELIYGSAGTSTTTALFPATTTRSQSVTSTASPSAGASGRNGQASPTAPRQGSASALYSVRWLASILVAVSSVLVPRFVI